MGWMSVLASHYSIFSSPLLAYSEPGASDFPLQRETPAAAAAPRVACGHLGLIRVLLT